MICEFCKKDHDGTYGSGRFCNKKCSSAFSTKDKRKEINEKVSKTLKENKNYYDLQKNGYTFKKGYDSRRRIFTSEDAGKGIQAAQIVNRDNYKQKLKTTPFNLLSKYTRSKILREEQNSRCKCCNNFEWMNNPIVLEYHHKDGNKHNNSKENSELLCPNCHSQTDTWKTRGGYKKYASIAQR